MTGVKGKSGRKKRAGPVGHFYVTHSLEKCQSFRFWCEHNHRTPYEVICEMMDRHVSECIAIEQMEDQASAADIARRIQQRDLKRQGLENKMDALLVEQKEKAAAQARDQNILTAYNEYIIQNRIDPQYGYEALCGDYKIDSRFEKNVSKFLAAKGLPADLNLLRPLIKNPKR
jgi:hypothetical protein